MSVGREYGKDGRCDVDPKNIVVRDDKALCRGTVLVLLHSLGNGVRGYGWTWTGTE